jgi:hypothetical protein
VTLLALLVVISGAFVHFLVRFSNWTVFVQHVSWISVLVFLPFYLRRVESKSVLWLSITSSFFGIASVVLRAQDWLTFCLDCNHALSTGENKFLHIALQTQMRGYLEFAAFFMWLVTLALAISILSRNGAIGMSVVALTLLVVQGALFVLELSASAFWFGSTLTTTLGPIYWAAHVREISTLMLIGYAVYMTSMITVKPKTS